MESLGIETPCVCFFNEGYGFSIDIHSNDYGFIDNDMAPAFAYVLDENELEIGLLNITGSCPKKISDIKEFRPPHLPGDPDPMKKTPLMKHRRNLIKWANSVIGEGEEKIKRWDWVQSVWVSSHRTSR
jgi:hypothetical protein